MSEKDNWLNKVDTWISKPENINGLINFLIILVSLASAVIYTMVKAGYDIENLVSMNTIVTAMVINLIMFLVKYAVNDWVVTFFRSQTRYKDEMEDINKHKRYIELNGLLRRLQVRIDYLNVERKKRALINKLDKILKKLEKKMLDSKKEEVVETIKKQMEDIDDEKTDILSEDYDHRKRAVKYNMLTRANIFAGSNLADDRDADITDDSRRYYHKGNMKNTFMILFASIFMGGITVDQLDKKNYVLLLIFILLLLVNIVVTYTFSKWIEETRTMAKISIRKNILIEFLDISQEEDKETIEEEK